MKDIVTRAIAWGMAGMLIGPASVYCLMLITLYRDPRCAPGGTGVCQLDLTINLTFGVIVGFALFFAVTFVRGILRRRRSTPL